MTYRKTITLTVDEAVAVQTAIREYLVDKEMQLDASETKETATLAHLLDKNVGVLKRVKNRIENAKYHGR